METTEGRDHMSFRDKLLNIWGKMGETNDPSKEVDIEFVDKNVEK